MTIPSNGYLLIFDLDGVLYRASEAIPDAPGSLAALREAGFQVAFLTNNAWYTAEEYATKLTAMGIIAAPQALMTAAMATGVAIAERHGSIPVLAIGGPGLRHYLAEAGLTVVSPESDAPVEAVAVGIDWEFTYAKLARAQNAILDGAAFYATNIDPRYPIEGGRFKPGAGSIVAAIATAAGREPIIIGKPSSTTVELLMERYGVGPKATLMIGDQLATDILAGNRAGCRTALITTGVSSRAEAELVRGDCRPTHVFDSLTALTRALIEDELMVVKRP